MKTGFDMTEMVTQEQHFVLTSLMCEIMEDTVSRAYDYCSHQKVKMVEPEVILCLLKWSVINENGKGYQMKKAFDECINQGFLSEETLEDEKIRQVFVKFGKFSEELSKEKSEGLSLARNTASKIVDHICGEPDEDKHSDDDDEPDTDDDEDKNPDDMINPLHAAYQYLCLCEFCKSVRDIYTINSSSVEPWQAKILNIIEKSNHAART